MKSILDPTFRYTNSANTDLRKTFARVRREQRRRERAAAGAGAAPSNVLVMESRRAGSAS